MSHSQDPEEIREYLKNLIDQIVDAFYESGYQSPHWDHEPTELELLTEKQYTDNCKAAHDFYKAKVRELVRAL